MKDELLDHGRRILAAQPFSALLGTTLEAFTPGHAELRLAVADVHRQQHAIVHGGVLAYLADTALAFAGGSVLGDAVTAELKLSFVRPARDCEALLAVAEVVAHTSSQAVCRADVFAVHPSHRVLVAAGQGTIRKAGPAS